MLKETFDKLIQFEAILKKCILDKFSNSIPQNKIDILTSSSFVIEDELKELKSAKEIQGKILRNMLNSIIDLKCEKEFTLNDGKTVTVLYGEDIENEVIEFYSIDISKKYKFDIDSVDFNLDLVKKLYEILGNGFDFNILNFNADYILSLDNLVEFANVYNKKLLSGYNKNEEEVVQQQSNENELLTSSINNIVDKQTPHVNDSLVANKDESISLDTSLSEVESPVGNEEVKEEIKNKFIINNDNNQSILSDDEYKNLCMKFARNEVLTPQEFNLLLMSTPNLVSEEDINKMPNLSANISVSEQDKISRGFTDYSFASYFVIVSVLIIITIGFIIL